MNQITKQELRQAIDQIMELNDGTLIDIGYFSKTNNIPSLRIRFMDTAGGRQLCIKQCGWRGEGSGHYFQPEQIEEFTSEAYRFLVEEETSTQKRRDFMMAGSEMLRQTAEKLQSETPFMTMLIHRADKLFAPFANTNQALQGEVTVKL